jgi:hypothetical protein
VEPKEEWGEHLAVKDAVDYTHSLFMVNLAAVVGIKP